MQHAPFLTHDFDASPVHPARAAAPVPIRRRALAALAGAAVLAGLLGSQAASAGSPVSPVPWRDCGDGFQCASVKVPLDYDRPNGRLIDLALAQLPAALLTRSACADGAIERYLVRLAPRPGATCETGVVPFVEVPSTQRGLLPDGAELALP